MTLGSSEGIHVRFVKPDSQVCCLLGTPVPQLLDMRHRAVGVATVNTRRNLGNLGTLLYAVASCLPAAHHDAQLSRSSQRPPGAATQLLGKRRQKLQLGIRACRHWHLQPRRRAAGKANFRHCGVRHSNSPS